MNKGFYTLIMLSHASIYRHIDSCSQVRLKITATQGDALLF